MNHIGLTIITVNYRATNSINNIERILSGLNKVEYIVVDNSDDFNRVCKFTKVISGNGNVGFGRACNLGVQVATYEKILFLNPDVILSINFIDDLFTATKQFDQNYIYGVRVSRGLQSDISKSNIPFLIYERRHISYDLMLVDELPVTLVSGACMLMSKQRFYALGGFDEKVFLYAEDLDLCLRNKESGGSNILLTKLSVEHVGGGTEKSNNKYRLMPVLRRLRNSFRGHNVILSKRYPKEFKIVRFITALYLASGLTFSK